jgi:hypothetical protein
MGADDAVHLRAPNSDRHFDHQEGAHQRAKPLWRTDYCTRLLSADTDDSYLPAFHVGNTGSNPVGDAQFFRSNGPLVSVWCPSGCQNRLVGRSRKI